MDQDKVDERSTQLNKQIKQGIFDVSGPTLTFNVGRDDADAVTSAKERQII